jgi:hypothetical protein
LAFKIALKLDFSTEIFKYFSKKTYFFICVAIIPEDPTAIAYQLRAAVRLPGRR